MKENLFKYIPRMCFYLFVAGSDIDNGRIPTDFKRFFTRCGFVETLRVNPDNLSLISKRATKKRGVKGFTRAPTRHYVPAPQKFMGQVTEKKKMLY
jgi:hypothetical protein